MGIYQLLFYGVIGFLGYAIGRVSHIYGGHLNAPDHWIYGLLLMVAGPLFFSNPWAVYIFSFGLGHFISDFKDFINLKFYGPDTPAPKKFWGID